MARNIVVRNGSGRTAEYAAHFTCPWCGTFIHNKATLKYSDWPDIGAGSVMFTANCTACLKPAILEIYVRHDATTGEATAHPTRKAKYAEPGVPEKIARDFTEALNCGASSYLYGASLVARRVLQMVARNVTGLETNLVAEINAMPVDLVPKVLKDAAHQIRYIGNDAAHADEVTEDDVRDLINFTEQILHAVYVMPAKVQATQQRRQ